jgi:uncharacterized RDD family membrane protein YckC
MAQAGPTGQDPAPPSGSGDWGAGGGGASSGFQVKTVVTEKGPAPGIVYAELPIRIGAYIVDSIILFACFFVLSIVVITVFAFTGLWLIGWAISTIVYIGGSAIYFIWSWRNLKASPGQKILNLETLDAGTGKAISTDQAIKRYIFLFGPSLLAQVFSFGGFGFAIIGTLVGLLAFVYVIYLLYTVSQNPKRQGYHDVQAGTVVIQRVATAA